MTAAVETMMATSRAYTGGDGVPWHKFGTMVEEAPTGRDALQIAGMGWLAEKKPLYVRTAGIGKNLYATVPGFYANVRATDGSVLGIVSEEYSVLQNHEAFEIIDEAMAAAGIEARYETAGSLYEGRKVWAMARIPMDLKVAGEEHLPYLLLTTGHDGNTGLDIMPTSVRVVCANTFALAHSRRGQAGGARYGISMTHTGDLTEKIAQAKELVTASLTAFEVYAREAEIMRGVEVTTEQINAYIRELFPAPIVEAQRILADLKRQRPDADRKTIDEEAIARAAAIRADRINAFRVVMAEEEPTVYGLFNTATGYADHARPRARRTGEARFARTTFGRDAAFKQQAWSTARELAGLVS